MRSSRSSRRCHTVADVPNHVQRAVMQMLAHAFVLLSFAWPCLRTHALTRQTRFGRGSVLKDADEMSVSSVAELSMEMQRSEDAVPSEPRQQSGTRSGALEVKLLSRVKYCEMMTGRSTGGSLCQDGSSDRSQPYAAGEEHRFSSCAGSGQLL